MEDLIRQAEKKAYHYVLRAFRFQSDYGLSWEKETLLGDLRKELRISTDEHSSFLRSIDNDQTLHRISQCRQGQSGSASHHHQHARQIIPQPVHVDLPSTTQSGKRVQGDIKLKNTQMLINEVEMRLTINPPDSLQFERAVKLLDEQEKALVDSIERVDEAIESMPDDSDDK